MDKKVKFNIEKDIFGRIQNNVFRSKTICTAQGQGIRLIRIDFFYWIKQYVCKYGHFGLKWLRYIKYIQYKLLMAPTTEQNVVHNNTNGHVLHTIVNCYNGI